ncbi:hypothetical protein EJ04DRAFT_134705 [Polyplosphaeria fusca]|uniref:Uncharacterized protein n=1 Tax=Polyplosphaeria fusca TaxID=682080 RepID=A0A9P4R5E4_9PLEO|nr:hypothetical protein EJ04DRAFT_134705 [Polyplosphaeria fusca]
MVGEERGGQARGRECLRLRRWPGQTTTKFAAALLRLCVPLSPFWLRRRGRSRDLIQLSRRHEMLVARANLSYWRMSDVLLTCTSPFPAPRHLPVLGQTPPSVHSCARNPSLLHILTLTRIPS